MFGFLKNKLKEWVDKAKDNLKPSKEEEITDETKKEIKPKKEKIKKKPTKTGKKKSKEKIIDLPKTKLQEEGTAIKIETEIEEGIPQEIIDKELEKAEELIEESKKERGKEPPMEFNPALQKYEPDLEEIKKEKTSFLSKIFKKKREETEEPKEKSFLTKLKSSFTYKISEDDFNKLFEDLELLLLENNVALEVVEDIKSSLSKKLIGKEIKKEDLEKEIKKELRNTLDELIIEPDDPIIAIKAKKQEKKEPFVILFFGINGTGKTTSIAKIANLLKEKGLSVVLAAADTFRAASIEQISEHADKLQVPIIKHNYQSDPSAVGFDAIKYAKSHYLDVVLIDTAGRMHTKTNLLAEMEKICRVTNPDLKIFVAESIAGNDATEQAKTFNEMIGIDGSILSKADIDEKGGTIISVSHATKKPIFYLGTGQKYKDLELFDKEKFIKNLGL